MIDTVCINIHLYFVKSFEISEFQKLFRSICDHVIMQYVFLRKLELTRCNLSASETEEFETELNSSFLLIFYDSKVRRSKP